MNAAFPPPNRAQDLSPVSIDSGSEWSGMNHYNNNNNNNNYTRSDATYNGPLGYARGDSVTPPDSASLNGPLSRPFGPSGMDGSQRRRPSEAGSQESSRATSVANSRSSDGTISDQQSRRYRRMEVELQQHYTVLKNFLKGGAPQPPRPNKARDKLLRLSPVQFHELSTDVFDELQRRQAATPLPGRGARRDNVPPFLQPRQNFHEKRNQARQKLSSLQTSRFRDLSTDVFCELERRFPHFNAPDGQRRDSMKSVSSRGGRPPPSARVHTANASVASSNGFPPRNGSMPGGTPRFDNAPGIVSSPTNEFGRPMPKQFQSNTITPNKSTMVEDDEDDDNNDDDESGSVRRNYRSSNAFGLESDMASPSSDKGTPATSVATSSRDMKSLQEKVSDLESALQERNDDVEKLRAELDKKVKDAQRLNKSLQQEIEKLRADHASKERDLQAQISSAKRESDEGSTWKTRHAELQEDYQDLRERYEEQQKITDEVSRQGQIFLREMRAMAEDGGGGNYEREEKLQLEVNKLEEEVKEWKGRYASAKTQLRTAKTGSWNTGIQQPNVEKSSQDDTFRRPDGMVQDIHITRFQIAIDELLQSARTKEPTAVLEYMKAVVIAVRDIAIDIDSAKPISNDKESVSKRIKLKSRVSATANNVITACKNFAAAGGISPVSLLDAAASHLSAAVVELVRMVKVCPSASDDLNIEQEEEEEIKEPPEGTPDPVNDAGYFSMSQPLRSESRAGSEYSALSSPGADDASGPGPDINDEQRTPRPDSEDERTNSVNGTNSAHGSTGLGIQAGLSLKEDDTELQELKIYLENQTDLLVQTIQALVGSIRNEDPMSYVNGHMSAILDVVENVLSAAEGAMEDPSWYQATLKERAASTVELLTSSKDKLMAAGNDPKAQVDGPSSKTFTQRLPPLAFRIARETKELVARIESVEAGNRGEVEEDFS